MPKHRQGRNKPPHLHVLFSSPDEGAVLADVVLVFKFVASDSRKVLWESVNNALLRRLRAPTGSLRIDLASYRLSGEHGVTPFGNLSLFRLIWVVPAVGLLQLHAGVGHCHAGPEESFVQASHGWAFSGNTTA
ncbi:UNVERIFIED_CONTAM: hypothetical protein K2H54_056636 [Gekko kuhli]